MLEKRILDPSEPIKCEFNRGWNTCLEQVEKEITKNIDLVKLQPKDILLCVIKTKEDGRLKMDAIDACKFAEVASRGVPYNNVVILIPDSLDYKTMSRHDAKRWLNKAGEAIGCKLIDEADDTAHWIDSRLFEDNKFHCSKCEYGSDTLEKWCPNCGARMTGGGIGKEEE